MPPITTTAVAKALLEIVIFPIQPITTEDVQAANQLPNSIPFAPPPDVPDSKQGHIGEKPLHYYTEKLRSAE